MRVKHPSVDGLEFTLLPSQVESWLSGGWVPVDATEPASEPVEPVEAELEDTPAEAVEVEAPITSRKRQPRKG